MQVDQTGLIISLVPHRLKIQTPSTFPMLATSPTCPTMRSIQRELCERRRCFFCCFNQMEGEEACFNQMEGEKACPAATS